MSEQPDHAVVAGAGRPAVQRRILVRRPSPALAEGELTHLERTPVDPELALRQWRGYVAAFEHHGWEVSEIETADGHPDGVFVEDTVVVFDDLAVLTSPGVESRRGEVATMEAAFDRLAVEGVELEVARIVLPGTLDGGDVLKVSTAGADGSVAHTAYVGLGSRTNAEGIAQLAALVRSRGWTVVAVPVSKVLHLKSGVTALPDGVVVGYEPLVDQPHPYRDFLAVPEEHGTAVVDLGDGTILMSSDAPETAALYLDRGWSVVTVDISEFEKLEGCVTCLSVRLR